MPSKQRGKKAKAKAAEQASNVAEAATTEGSKGSVAGRALALRSHRPKLALAGAGVAAATVALLATLLARRTRGSR
jgi:hypothetical protein